MLLESLFQDFFLFVRNRQLVESHVCMIRNKHAAAKRILTDGCLPVSPGACRGADNRACSANKLSGLTLTRPYPYSCMRFHAVAIIVICLTGLATHRVQAQTTLETLAASYANAQAVAIKAVNAKYAASAKALVKNYMLDDNMAQARAASDWMKRLSGPDPLSAADGILSNADSEDPLASLQTRYLEEHNDALARVDNAFLPKAQALQRSATDAADVDTASAAAGLVSQIQAKLGSAATSGLPSGDAEALFAPEKQPRWKPQSGTWRWEGALLTGSGDSEIQYDINLEPPFVVQFTMNIMAGSRERLEMDQVGVHNVGYQDKFGPDGGDENKFFAFKHNQPYHCVLVVTRKNSDFYVEGSLIAEGAGESKKVEKILLHGGDGWSPGTTEYQDFIIIRGADQIPQP